MEIQKTINQYIDDLKSAIENINETYFYNQRDLEYIKSQIGKNVHQSVHKLFIPKYGERLFCYELYYQFRLIIEKSDLYKDVLLQAEIRKDFLLKEVYVGLSIKKLSKVFIPDFIIHDPKNAERQRLIVEVKTNPNKEKNSIKKIINDINKLMEFIEKYKFHHGVFIITNYTVDDISNRIKHYKEKLKFKKETPNKITILIKPSFGKELTQIILADILQCNCS
jgi:hypothetical protein